MGKIENDMKALAEIIFSLSKEHGVYISGTCFPNSTISIVTYQEDNKIFHDVHFNGGIQNAQM